MKKLTTAEFIEKAKAVHGDKFNYSKVDYKGNRVPVTIIHQGEEFEQKPVEHLQGKVPRKMSGHQKLTTAEFIQKAIDIHGTKYDYSKVDYKTALIKVTIICPIHGEFEQTPNAHISAKKGCIKCGHQESNRDRKLTNEEFTRRASELHNGRYDYSKVNYINGNEQVEIICSKHGSFWQKALHHLYPYEAKGCPKCSSRISPVSQRWLDSLGIPDDSQHREVRIGSYLVDGFDPLTNTVYEFHGDFWHGNPNKYDPNDMNWVTKTTFGYLFEQTQKKTEELKNLGYTVVEKWET